MLDSLCKILNHYIDGTTRFNAHSIQIHRGENPEDIFYLCRINNAWYIVYETDYIGSLSYVLEKIIEILFPHNIQPLHWLVKKDFQDELKIGALSIKESIEDKNLRKALILRPEGSYLRFMVLNVEPPKYVELAARQHI